MGTFPLVQFSQIASNTSSTADITSMIAYFSLPLLALVFAVTVFLVALGFVARMLIKRAVPGAVRAVSGRRRGRGRRRR